MAVAEPKRPEDIESIDDLMKEGDDRVKSLKVTGGLLGLPDPEPSAYYERALQLIGKSETKEPEKEHHIRYWLAAYLGFKWGSSEAIPHAEKCVELKPEDADSRLLLAKLYHDNERFLEILFSNLFTPENELRTFTKNS